MKTLKGKNQKALNEVVARMVKTVKESKNPYEQFRMSKKDEWKVKE